MKSVAIIQARLGSRRFRGKVLQDLGGRPVLAHVVERCQAIPGIDQVALTIPQGPEDDPLADWAVDHGIACHRGQLPLAGTAANDCLTAYYRAAYALNADVIVRVTADCPYIDPTVAGEVLSRVTGHAALFASNCQPVRTYPDGLDVEAFTWAVLEGTWLVAGTDPDRWEHVTPGIRAMAWNPHAPWEAKLGSVQYHENLSAVRWTVDMPEDLVKLRKIVAYLPPGAFTLADTRKAAEAAGEWP